MFIAGQDAVPAQLVEALKFFNRGAFAQVVPGLLIGTVAPVFSDRWSCRKPVASARGAKPGST